MNKGFIYLLLFVIHCCNINAFIFEEKYIRYYIYNNHPQNSDTHRLVRLKRDNFQRISLKKSSEVKVICHGYMERTTESWINKTISAYVFIGTTNIILIDWSAYSKRWYSEARMAVQNIGETIGKDLVELARIQDVPLELFHVIGYSLSAHIVGIAGKTVTSHTGHKLGRITGLDPANLLLRPDNHTRRLAASDAHFVDVIHTYLFTGYLVSLGTVDFWPNGGRFQPGCPLLGTCSHARATQYYAESITSVAAAAAPVEKGNSTTGKFIACKCASQRDLVLGLCKDAVRTTMGEFVDRGMYGDFRLCTGRVAPFALGGTCI